MRYPFAHIPLLPILIGIIIGILLGNSFNFILIIAIIGISLISIFAKQRIVAITSIAIVLGWICTIIEAKPAINTRLLNKELAFSGIVSSIKSNDVIRTAVIDIDMVSDTSVTQNITPFKCQVSIPSLNPHFEIGNRITFLNSIETLSDTRDLPDEFDYVKYLNQQSIYTQAFVHPERIKISCNNENIIWIIKRFKSQITHWIACLPLSTESIEFLNATITGNASMISENQRLKYSTSGLAHILALSGLHVGIITFFIAFILYPLDFIGWRKIRYIITICILWGYAIMTGLSPSVTRAVIMASVFLIAHILQRHHSPFNSLCLAAIIILAVAPNSLYDIGFQLSFCAVLSILLFSDKLNIINRKNRVLYHLMSLACVSIAAMIGTGIISAFYFHNFPIYFLFANVIISYLLPAIIIGGLVALIIFILGFEPNITCKFIDFTYSLIDNITTFITNLPGANIDNLYFSGWVIIPYIATIICLYYAICNKKVKWYIITTSCIIFSIAMGYLTQSQYPTTEYFIPRNAYYTNIIVRDTTSLYIISTATGGDSIDAFNKCLDKYHDYIGRRNIDSIIHVPNNINAKHLYRKDATIVAGTDLIIIIDNDNDLKYPTHKPKYSLVCRGFKGNILDVNKIINADTILLSRDLNKRRHDKYVDSCQTHNIPYISLRDTCFHKVLIN